MDWIFVITDHIDNKPTVRALKVLKETKTRWYVDRYTSNKTVVIEGGHLKGSYIPKSSGSICTTPAQAIARYNKGILAAHDRALAKIKEAEAKLQWFLDVQHYPPEEMRDFIVGRELAIRERKKKEWVATQETPLKDLL